MPIHDWTRMIASYEAAIDPCAYVEPVAIGRPLIEMPLFLTTGRYIDVPLERTYTMAYKGVPQRWKKEVDG